MQSSWACPVPKISGPRAGGGGWLASGSSRESFPPAGQPLPKLPPLPCRERPRGGGCGGPCSTEAAQVSSWLLPRPFLPAPRPEWHLGIGWPLGPWLLLPGGKKVHIRGHLSPACCVYLPPVASAPAAVWEHAGTAQVGASPGDPPCPGEQRTGSWVVVVLNRAGSPLPFSLPPQFTTCKMGSWASVAARGRVACRKARGQPLPACLGR